MNRTRQVIGKHRSVTVQRARGAQRRAALVRAATQLLDVHSAENIAFSDIAESARLPVSSAYHFYANKYDVFAAVALRMREQFGEELRRPVPVNHQMEWKEIIVGWIDRAVAFFRSNPAAMKVLLGPTIPPGLRPAHPRENQQTFKDLAEQFEEHFEIEEVGQFPDKLRYAFVIVEALFTTGLKRFGDLDSEIVGEARRACCGYLATYLPEPLIRKPATESGWDSFPL